MIHAPYRVLAALLVGGLLVLAACDGGDDAAGGDSDGFCDLLADAAGLSIDPTSPEGLEEVRDFYVQLEEVAPDAVADDVATLVDAIEGLSSGEFSLTDPSGGEQLAAASQAVNEYVSAECPDVGAGTTADAGG